MPTALQQLYTANAMLNRYGAGTGAESNGLSATSPLAQTLAYLQSATSSFWLMVLFYPIFIIAITYAFVVQLSNIIGGRSYMGSRLRSFI